VIDLRTTDELERHGRAALTDARYHHVPLFDVLPPLDREGESWSKPSFLVDRYLQIIGEGRDRIGAAVQVLADPDTYPAVFHCAVGKDRTGILAALVLSWLGVADDVVAADYAISSHSLLPMVAAAEARGGIDPKALEGWRATVVASTPDVMHGLLARVREEHGDLDAFAAWLDVADALPALRAALLDPA
jgi:protein-tyrosine phosphatase